jgi:TRAP-type C4-dicarboxylate transport system substrate-binding protein
VFDSIAHMRRALDGAAGERILASFAERGLIGLCFFDAGVRCMYNRRHPVLRPADLSGLKLRVPPSDMFMELLRAYGVNATPLPFGEVYSALQTHLIDGAEKNWPSFISSRQFEVARFWSETEHAYTPDVLLMSARVYALLAPAEQALLRSLARAAVARMRVDWDLRVEQARALAQAGGVQINPVDHATFRAAAQPVLDRHLADPQIRALYDQIRASAEAA